MRSLLLLLSIVSLLSSCQEQRSHEDKAQSKEGINNSTTKKKSPQRVTIYRYGNFSAQMATALQKELSKTFPEVVLSDEVLTLPEESYLKERNRYNGSGLLKDLRQRKHNDAVIGLTNQIIYQANEISPTFGIMGLSPMGTHTCVVSSKIPRNGQTHTLDNFVKLSLHELGHAYGLPHCPDQHCYMVDAEHKMKFTQTIGFCNKCQSKLKADGWNLK